MAVRRRTTSGTLSALPWCTLLMALAAAHAEHLPIKVYSAADGLPSSSVDCIVRDSRGLLWFCTKEGLASFDGYHFTNFGVDRGLPDAVVLDLIETHDGEYWVLTASGISRFLPGVLPDQRNAAGPRRMFETHRFPPDTGARRQPIKLADASGGRLWCLMASGRRWCF